MLRQKHAVTAATARQIRRSALCRLLLSVRIWVSAAMGGEGVLFKSDCDLVQNVQVPVCMCGAMSVSPGARVGVVQENFWQSMRVEDNCLEEYVSNTVCSTKQTHGWLTREAACNMHVSTAGN